jgi:hypothetical protein
MLIFLSSIKEPERGAYFLLRRAIDGVYQLVDVLYVAKLHYWSTINAERGRPNVNAVALVVFGAGDGH